MIGLQKYETLLYEALFGGNGCCFSNCKDWIVGEMLFHSKYKREKFEMV
jgi:hypothetical protein